MKRLLAWSCLLAGCAHAAPTGLMILHVAPPDARIVIDGQYVGSASQLSGHRLRLRAGKRRLEVTADGYYGARREPEVAHDPVEVKVDLHPVPEGER